jgi:3-dehydroquinate dehydratase-1
MTNDIFSKRPAICASIIANTVEEYLEDVRGVDGADIIEIRADGLNVRSHDIQRAYKSEIKRLLRNVRIQTDLPVILTLRGEKEGGAFAGTEADRIECIRDSLKLADIVDIELAMEGEQRDELIKEARQMNKKVIVSYHDLSSTPAEDAMMSILEEEVEIGANVAKLAVTANSKKDVIKLLNVTREMAEGMEVPICTIAMGDYGRISRIVAPFFGSVMTYGYVSNETAPGQLSILELRRALEILGLK